MRGTTTDPQLLYITAVHPDDPGEEFFEPEIETLRRRGRVLVVPLRPTSRRSDGTILAIGLWAPSVLLAAVRVACRRPGTAWRAIRSVVDPRRPTKSIRNLLVVPKSLWLTTLVGCDDVIYAAWLSTPATAAYIVSQFTGCEWGSAAHRRDILDATPLKRKIEHARVVRAVSESSRAALIERSAHGRIEVVHLGVRLAASATWRPSTSKRHRVACVASLIPIKNQATVLRALTTESGQDVELHLIGRGPTRSNLEDLADQLGVADRVVFHGQVAHEDLLGRMASNHWDLVTLPSTVEGIPVSLIEAASFGIPLVASDVGGVAELLHPVGGTLITDPYDYSAFAEAWRAKRCDWSVVHADLSQEYVRSSFSTMTTSDRLCRLLGWQT